MSQLYKTLNHSGYMSSMCISYGFGVRNWVRTLKFEGSPNDPKVTSVQWESRRNDTHGYWEYKIPENLSVGDYVGVGRKEKKTDAFVERYVILLSITPKKMVWLKVGDLSDLKTPDKVLMAFKHAEKADQSQTMEVPF